MGITARVAYAVERFADAHPSHCVGPFRSYGHGRPYLSIGTRHLGSKSTWMFTAADGVVSVSAVTSRGDVLETLGCQ